MLEGLLRDQQSLTAVDRFSQFHDDSDSPVAEKYYRDLIPLNQPEEGEQYGFEVDLSACSGCKACVTACHNLNGLEEDETWRNTGLLVGGSTELPIIQHVTTACHHCLEPACMKGCPVEAYEKDPVTGIVKHLDDQCIGCQYCILNCPYEVPVYSPSKGIVRKCDMCSQRLAVGEAPACVQACPNQAIRIRVISNEAIRVECEAAQFLPGAPDSALTIPTTRYVSEKPLPRNTLPADYYSVHRSHGHLPLVFMLVFTQMSVGAFVVEQAIFSYFSFVNEQTAAAIRPWHLLAALLLGFLGLGASVFHLGRPFVAYRAILGLRTSWLSREILAFGLFAGCASLYALVVGLNWFGVTMSPLVEGSIGMTAIVAGIVGVLCSVMIYVDTRRPLWTPFDTSAKFLLTSLMLGLPTALLVSIFAAVATDSIAIADVMTTFGGSVCQLLVLCTVAKLLVDSSVFLHLRSNQQTPHKRSALLLTGELGMTACRRYIFAIGGGIVLPLFLAGEPVLAPQGFHPWFLVISATLMLALLTVGELHERYLFFVASVAPKMPGGQA